MGVLLWYSGFRIWVVTAAAWVTALGTSIYLGHGQKEVIKLIAFVNLGISHPNPQPPSPAKKSFRLTGVLQGVAGWFA